MEIVSGKFTEMGERFEKDTEVNNHDVVEWWVTNSGELAVECRDVSNKMQSDKSLRIRVGGDDPKPSTEKSLHKIDLIGVKCPFNYVKTKLKLESMAPGDSLEVLLDQGEPEKNVPRSVQNDGHKVLSMGKTDGYFKMLIEKI